MTRITVEAEMVECRVGFTARPGDRLLIMGGHCFGLLPEPAAEPMPVPLVNPTPPPAMRAKVLAKAAPTRPDLSREVLAEALTTPGTTRAIAKRVQAWHHAPHRVGYLIHTLLKEGLVKPTDETAGRRFPAYELTDAGRNYLQAFRVARGS